MDETRPRPILPSSLLRILCVSTTGGYLRDGGGRRGSVGRTLGVLDRLYVNGEGRSGGLEGDRHCKRDSRRRDVRLWRRRSSFRYRVKLRTNVPSQNEGTLSTLLTLDRLSSGGTSPGERLSSCPVLTRRRQRSVRPNSPAKCSEEKSVDAPSPDSPRVLNPEGQNIGPFRNLSGRKRDRSRSY